MTPPNCGAVAWMQYDVKGVHVTRRGSALVSFSKGTLFRRGIYGALRPPGRSFRRSTPLSRRSCTRAVDPDQDNPHRPGRSISAVPRKQSRHGERLDRARGFSERSIRESGHGDASRWCSLLQLPDRVQRLAEGWRGEIVAARRAGPLDRVVRWISAGLATSGPESA